MSDEQNQNQGEGNQTAAKQYNEQTKQFVETQDVEAKAQEAAAAMEGDEAAELRQAEDKGRSKALEEDPQVHRDR